MQFAKKLIGNEEERAVSPVIGVILMVAITVILAAVIAAFVLDLGQSQSANVNAGVSIDDDRVVLTDKGNSDGVIVRDSSGNQEFVLTNTGESDTVSGGDDYSVVAFTGTAASTNDETVINTFSA